MTFKSKNINIQNSILFSYLMIILGLCLIPYISEIHMFRQSQIAITTEYFNFNNNIFYPQIPVFGNDNTYAGFEFPFIQYFTYLITSVIPVNQIIFLKLISFFSFIGISIILYNLLEDNKYKKQLILFYLANPIHIVFVPTINIEYYSIFTSLLAFFVISKYQKSYLLILFISVIAALSKIIIFLCFSIPLLLLIFKEDRKNYKKLIFLFITFLISLIFFYLWKEWMDVLMNSGFYSSIFSSNPTWMLGTIKDRTSIENIIELIIKLLIFVSPLTVFFLLKKSCKNLFITLFLIFMFGPFVFIQLHLTHDYYYIYTPVLLILYLISLDKKPYNNNNILR